MIQRFDYANIKKKNSARQIPPWAKSQNKGQTEKNICNTNHRGLISIVHKGSITELGSSTPPEDLWAKVIQRKLIES